MQNQSLLPQPGQHADVLTSSTFSSAAGATTSSAARSAADAPITAHARLRSQAVAEAWNRDGAHMTGVCMLQDRY